VVAGATEVCPHAPGAPPSSAVVSVGAAAVAGPDRARHHRQGATQRVRFPSHQPRKRLREREHPQPTTIDPLAAPPTAGLERAIWELIEGHDTPRAIAARNGLTHQELLATFARYVDAGRTVIG
jgi:hypothetical protein